MKLAKMLGLAIVAAAVAMILGGVGSAAASTACKANESPCSEANTYPNGTVLKMKNVVTDKQCSKAFGTCIECTASTMSGQITTNPGNPQVIGEITSATWTCNNNCTVVALQLPWRLHLEATSGGNGIVWIENDGTHGQPARSVSNCTGIRSVFNECVWKTKETQPNRTVEDAMKLEFVGGNPAHIKANAVQEKAVPGSCGQAEWNTEYELSEPKPMFVV